MNALRYLIAMSVMAGASLVSGNSRCRGADLWGGSVDITSDYLVRGISRSNDQAALQLDLHYVADSGFIAGAFASNTQLDHHAPRDAELSGYIGFTWPFANDWRGKVFASYYAYPWNVEGAQYNYGELEFGAAYRDWLEIRLSYSPDSPRFSPVSYYLESVTAESGELNLQRQLWGKLLGTGGIGYSHLAGPAPIGYGYGSVGLAYDWSPVVLALSFVDTTSAANRVFYRSAAGSHWIGSIIWRF
jgi:uncharacterized protein (TIGR02001 family)